MKPRAWGFKDRRIAEKLKRMAMRNGGSESISLPKKATLQLRAYLAVPIQQIPPATKEYVNGEYEIIPGSGQAIIYQLKDSSGSSSSSGSENTEVRFVAKREEGDPITETIYNLTSGPIGKQHEESSPEQTCDDDVVFVVQESTSGKFFVVEQGYDLPCDGASAGSGSESPGVTCFDVPIPGTIEFDSEACEINYQALRICIYPNGAVTKEVIEGSGS